jgi:hypothetical protein
MPFSRVIQTPAQMGKLFQEFSQASSSTASKLIGRRHVKTLMRRMGIEALYAHHQARARPQDRGIEITRPNQVWATDIGRMPQPSWRKR